MQVKISARHGHLSEATQAKITTKVERLSRLFERLTAIEVTIDLEHKDTPTVDLKVSAEHKHDFVATEQAGEMWASVDGAVDPSAQAQENRALPVERGPHDLTLGAIGHRHTREGVHDLEKLDVGRGVEAVAFPALAPQ